MRATSTVIAVVALTLGCASTPDSGGVPWQTLTEMRDAALRGCEERGEPCPAVLLDGQLWEEYPESYLSSIPASDIAGLNVIRRACFLEWRYGRSLPVPVIEIFTARYEGPRATIEDMPLQERLLCDVEPATSDGRDLDDAMVDALTREQPRTVGGALVDMVGVCARRGTGCPLLLVDTRPSWEYTRSELFAMPISSIDRITTTKGECTGIWRFGERGRNGAIEIYTEGFEGEALRHEEMPEEERLRCEAERSRRSSR